LTKDFLPSSVCFLNWPLVLRAAHQDEELQCCCTVQLQKRVAYGLPPKGEISPLADSCSAPSDARGMFKKNFQKPNRPATVGLSTFPSRATPDWSLKPTSPVVGKIMYRRDSRFSASMTGFHSLGIIVIGRRVNDCKLKRRSQQRLIRSIALLLRLRSLACLCLDMQHVPPVGPSEFHSA